MPQRKTQVVLFYTFCLHVSCVIDILIAGREIYARPDV